MEVKYVSIFAIVLVLLSGIPLVSGAGMNYANAKYASDTQTQGNANECDTGTNCAINSPQTQGDGTANSPTNLQISKFSDQSEDQPPTQGALPMIRVFKEVICPTGFVCPTPDKFTMKVAVGNPFATAFPNPFPGSSTGTTVFVEFDTVETVAPITDYRVTEESPPTPTGLFLSVRRSGDCDGFIGPQESKTCTFTNEYTALSSILVKKKVICPTGFVCPTPDKFTMKLEAIGGIVDPATFPGSETGTRVTIAIPETSAAPYRVTETFPPPVSGLNLFASQDMGCLGDIRPQESKTCSIINEYRVAPTP